MTYHTEPIHHRAIVFGLENRFVYTNWQGVKESRRVIARYVWFGTTPHHLEPQWLLEAFDMDKRDYRTFALSDIEVV
jgi:predicted DNA-binding transcriptional regulator YafY